MTVKKVILVNQDQIPHYRIPIYNYLSNYLKRERVQLAIVSGGIQQGSSKSVQFKHFMISLETSSLVKLFHIERPDIVIYWVKLKYLYLFPMLVAMKAMGIKSIYWGHGTDLYTRKARTLKKLGHFVEFQLSDALLLYADHLKSKVNRRFHSKTFVANNTLCYDDYQRHIVDKENCLEKFGITTKRNIICIGRMQKRKKIDVLIEAFRLLERRDTGLILVGPDDDGILEAVRGENIFKIGPLYGDERLDLLAASDIFCLPGALGLSIVDAMFCGLPVVTEAGEISPEIMYLKDGINGFLVPKGDVRQLALRLDQLLRDQALRENMSKEASKEIRTNGHIDRLCEGFMDAIRFAQ